MDASDLATLVRGRHVSPLCDTVSACCNLTSDHCAGLGAVASRTDAASTERVVERRARDSATPASTASAQPPDCHPERRHKLTNCYDVLAVQPLSDRAFASACTVLDVDVIAIDFCCRRLPFGCAASLRAYRNVPDPLMSDAGCASRCCGRPSAEVSSLSWSIRRCCANRAPGPGFLQMPRSCYNSPAARAFSSAAALDEPPNCEARSRPPA